MKYDLFIPQVEVLESTDGTTIIPVKWVVTDPTTYNEAEKEKMSLDGCLQLIISDSMDLNMFGTISHIDSAKQIWDHIEVLYKDTEGSQGKQETNTCLSI